MPRKTVVILALVFVLPLLLAIGYFQYLVHFGSGQTSNYGSLISPMRQLETLPSAVDKHWTYLVLSQQGCHQPCRELLRKVETVRLLTNEQMRRIKTLFISPHRLTAEDKPSNLTSAINELDRSDTGLDSLRQDIIHIMQASSLAKDSAIDQAIYLVDPIGNLMMVYMPNNQDPQKMLADIKRLLKYSNLG